MRFLVTNKELIGTGGSNEKNNFDINHVSHYPS